LALEKRTDNFQTEESAKTKQTTPKAHPKAMRKKLKREPKLVVSAEVSPKVWDAVEKRVRSRELKYPSDLIRTDIDRLLD